MITHSSILAWEIPMDRGAWSADTIGHEELDTTERRSTHDADDIEFLHLRTKQNLR